MAAPARRKGGLGKGFGSGLDAVIPNRSGGEKQGKNQEKIDHSAELSTKNSKNVENLVKKGVDGIENAILVNITSVERNKDQPRENFEEESLQELADSIRQFGIIQPLLVKEEGKRYKIVAGERRWRAAKLAGLKKVPVIVKDFTDQEIMEISLIENIQREDLSVLEEAMAYQKLLQEFGYRQEDLAERLGKSRSAVTNKLRLLKLPPDVLDMLKEKKLSEGHARTLLSLPEPAKQQEAAEIIVQNGLSVRDAERLIKQMLSAPKKKQDNDWQKEDSFIYEKLEEDLRSLIGTKVSIQRQNKEKGKIIIDYYSIDELERIMDLMKK